MTNADRCYSSIVAAGEIPREYLARARYINLEIMPYIKKMYPEVHRLVYSMEILPKTKRAWDENVEIIFSNGWHSTQVNILPFGIWELPRVIEERVKDARSYHDVEYLQRPLWR